VRRRRLVLTVLAIVVFVAAVLLVGLEGLIPFGLLLAFSTPSGEAEARRSVILTPRNLLLATAIVVAFGWFWLWHLDEAASTLVVIAGVLIALPLALQESETDAARYRTVAVTKRSLIMGLLALVVFVNVYYAFGQGLMALVAVCVVVPVSLAASRLWGLAGDGLSSGCSATRYAGSCGPTSSRPSTSGCGAGWSRGSWPPVARTPDGSCFL
jgi:hypothetical protein